MDKFNIYILIISFVFLITLLSCIIFRLKVSQKENKYILEISKKFDDYTDIKKISYIFAEEIRKILGAEIISIISYEYSETEILATVPNKIPDKEMTFPHELYLILENLNQNSIFIIENKDIQSEHFKTYFPLFNYEEYKIIQIYNDANKIITLEIYGNLSYSLRNKKTVLKELIRLYQKAYRQQIYFINNDLKTKKNEIIINFLDKMRSTLQEDDLKKIILENSAHSFKADRTCFLTINNSAPLEPVLIKEYLANPYVKSLYGNNLDYKSVLKQIQQNETNPPVFAIENSEKFIKEKHLEGSAVDIFLEQSEIKSSYPFIIYKSETEITYLVLQYTKQPVIFSKNDFEIMQLLTKQINIALTQSKTQTELLNNSQKEKFLIDLISTLRSSLDLKKVASEFTAKVGRFFNADRCIIRFFDEKKKEFRGYDEAYEYKKYYYTPSSKNTNLQRELVEFLLQNEKFHDTLAIQYTPEIFKNDFEYRENILNYADKYKIKAYLASYIRYNGKLSGILALHFNELQNFSAQDENFVKAITDQLGMAIYQSELYNNSQNAAKKEKLLKEVYADTTRLNSKKQIFGYFNEKIIELLNAAGVVFIEFSKMQSNKKEYYENYKTQNINLSKFKDFNFFNEIINKRISGFYYDLTSNENGYDFQNFIKETNLTYFMTFPVQNNLLLLLFFDTKKEITKFEKNILFSLTDILPKAVNDIVKINEINNLKESFYDTLAHNLQIPLIAERNILNYLSDNPKIKKNSMAISLIKELKKTNFQTEETLKTLAEIYQYERNKKELNKSNSDILILLDNAINKASEKFKEKNIRIKKEVKSQYSELFIDSAEITKVLVIFLIYMMYNAENNSEIFIAIEEKNTCLQCCISSSAKINNKDIENIIFDRKIFTNNLENRVNEGIYLYLAQLIINAHNGKIYKNNNSKANILCIELDKIT